MTKTFLGLCLSVLFVVAPTLANAQEGVRAVQVRTTYSAQSNDYYDLTASANEAYSLALQKCQQDRAVGCYISKNAECSHIGMSGGSVRVSARWYCTASAEGLVKQLFVPTVRTGQSQYHEDMMVAIQEAEQNARSSCHRGDAGYAGKNCVKSKETTCQKKETEKKSFFGKTVTTYYSCQAEFTGEVRTRL